MAKARITIESPAGKNGVLDVKDAMQQVLDFFELLSADEDEGSYVWNLVFAATNSPFSAEAEAVSVNPDVNVTAISATRVREATDYLEALSKGIVPARRLSRRRTEAAKKFLRRNVNGIGRTTASFGPLRPEALTVTPKTAAIALAAVEQDERTAPSYLPSKLERVEIGSVEGTFEDVSTDYGLPAIRITERTSGKKITCRVDQELVEKIAGAASFNDVWSHKRIMVRGRITYGPDGTITRIVAKDIKRISPRDMTLRDVEDRDFTDNLESREYLDRFREGELVDRPKYYWDACMWLALIKREPGRFDACKYVIERAQRGEVEIWTSAFTLAEVYKRKCGETQTGLPEADDDAFEDYIEQDFVVRVQLDSTVGSAARKLLRQYPTLGKPQDAIHLATALLENVHELHTFDQKDLLSLSEKIERYDGKKLKICHPPTPPDPLAGTLFEGLSENGDSREDETPAAETG